METLHLVVFVIAGISLVVSVAMFFRELERESVEIAPNVSAPPRDPAEGDIWKEPVTGSLYQFKEGTWTEQVYYGKSP